MTSNSEHKDAKKLGRAIANLWFDWDEQYGHEYEDTRFDIKFGEFMSYLYAQGYEIDKKEVPDDVF